jgi:ubiquinone/menaquinone biosynthesis C-methylase UbiE
MIGLYDKYILPKVTHLVCSSRPARIQRQKIVPFASGMVLEIGIGSGLNLGFYDPDKVDNIIGLDPSEEMLAIAEKSLPQHSHSVRLVKGSAEDVPLKRDSVDTIVITYVMCSIPEVELALKEFKRVLKPGGRLLFCEHGMAPDPFVRKWQNRMNPIWKRVSGGCHLNRNIPKIIESGSFRIENMESMFIPGPRMASYNYWGVAKPL